MTRQAEDKASRVSLMEGTDSMDTPKPKIDKTLNDKSKRLMHIILKAGSIFEIHVDYCFGLLEKRILYYKLHHVKQR